MPIYEGMLEKIIELGNPQEGSMYLDEPHARIGYQGSAIARAKNLALKGLLVLGGALLVASAFVVSLVFLAIVLAAGLIVGGYLWWKTRELRKQMRAHMQAQSHPRYDGDIIEGEVITVEPTRR